MEIVHSLPHIKSMGVRPELIAGHFNLDAAELPGNPAGLGEHSLSDAPASADRIHGKLHDFRYVCSMVQLFLESQVQNADYLPILFADETIILSVV